MSGSIVIDESDPCAAAAALRTIYTRIVTGQAAISVSFKGGETGVERSVTYNKAEPDRLLRLIRFYEQECARLGGQRTRRYAVRGGGR